jgi:hypothetical protein
VADCFLYHVGSGGEDLGAPPIDERPSQRHRAACLARGRWRPHPQIFWVKRYQARLGCCWAKLDGLRPDRLLSPILFC